MAHGARTKKMYLGKNYNEIRDNFRTLFPHESGDHIIVARRKGLWMLTLKRAAYIKHHIARLTPSEIQGRVTESKSKLISDRISFLIKKGIL